MDRRFRSEAKGAVAVGVAVGIMFAFAHGPLKGLAFGVIIFSVLVFFALLEFWWRSRK